jgi:hypothetical protein
MTMEFRLRVIGDNCFRVITRLGVAFKRVTSILPPTPKENLSVDMLAYNCLPYEVSRTYRSILTEFECRRGQNLAEVRQLQLRSC